MSFALRVIEGFTAILMLTSQTSALAGIQKNGTPAIECRLESQYAQLAFIANNGQISKNIRFYAPTDYGAAGIDQNGDLRHLVGTGSGDMGQAYLLVEHFVRTQPLEITGSQISGTRVSSFKGRDRSLWFSNIPTFRIIDLGYIHPGIMVRVRSVAGGVEKLFTIEPGASPDKIRISLTPTLPMNKDHAGRLLVNSPRGSIAFSAPVAYQEIDGRICPVDVSYRIDEFGYGFSVGHYDKSLPLIIDPMISSTFAGTGQEDQGRAAVVDDAGNVFVAGITAASDFPGTAGGFDDTYNGGTYDIMVMKFDPALRNLLACTYLGGSGYEGLYNLEMRLDSDGNICLTGHTTSSDFPVTPGAYDESFNGGPLFGDVFVSRLSNDLTSLLASTYLGSTTNDRAGGLAVDGDGNIYVVGQAGTRNFPTTSTAYDTSFNGSDGDGFISIFDPDLTTLMSSTFIGGSGFDECNDIVLDGMGKLYVAGSTLSGNFPATSGSYDQTANGGGDFFAACFSDDLTTLIAATYIGGAAHDFGLSIDLNADKDVYVSGAVSSTDFPTTEGAFDRTFNGGGAYHADLAVIRLDSNLVTLKAGTYLGGSSGDDYQGEDGNMFLGPQGDVYVVGGTPSNDFPTTANAYDQSYNGGRDVFVSRFSADLSVLTYSSYLGGSLNDYALYNQAKDVLDNGDIYISGETASSDFPVIGEVYQQNNQGSKDAFISRFTFSAFTRITEGPHVNETGHSWSANWIDYDNDGYLDIFASNLDTDNTLYHNDGDGTFTKVTGLPFLPVNIFGIGSAGTSWVDFNNDGYLDVFIATFREGSPPVNVASTNNGDGTFTQISGSAIVTGGGMSIDPSWVDYNNDGLLDLYVANHEGPNFFFKQDDTGFVKISTGPIATDNSHSNSACWADYDSDGYQDLFVANGWFNPNDCLYENNGDGNFTKIISGSPTESPGVSWGGSWGDYDNDGFMDLFVTQSVWGSPETSYDSLYHNNGDGTFSSPSGIELNLNGSYSTGSTWGDFDNDGDLDLYVASEGPNLLYENSGDGSFVRITEGEVVTDNENSNGCAAGDYDRDGDLDLFVTNAQQNNTLYRNNGNSNHWINIKCVGTISNRSAIGTRIRVKAVIDGNPVWQIREISSKTGKNGQNSLNAHFGLGNAETVDSIEVYWPSGMIDILTGVDINQFMIITETICGDANNDGSVNIGDVVFLVNHIFNDGPAPLKFVAGDVNCDGNINVGDAVYLGNVIFRPGSPVPCSLCT